MIRRRTDFSHLERIFTSVVLHFVKSKLKNIVGQRVRKARARSKPPLTQKELSTRVVKCGADIDRAGIAKIETGIRRVYDFELLALAKALGVTVNALLRHSRSL